MTPFERVIARRPFSDDVRDGLRSFGHSLDITWTDTTARHDDGGIAVGPELTRDDERIRYLAIVHFMYTNSFPIVLDIRRGPARDTDDGTCELGPIINGSWSEHLEWYLHGVDLVALRESGYRMSWEAAQWLHAAGRTELDALHISGLSIGPHSRRIRLRLCHTPFSKSRENPGKLLSSGPPDGEDGEEPDVFAFVGARPGASSLVQDRAQLAAAIGGLTRHPDPQLDSLLNDPDPAGLQVLRDLVLQRDRPTEALLLDRVGVGTLAEAPLGDNDSIDDELGVLWKAVVELDPMLVPREWEES